MLRRLFLPLSCAVSIALSTPAEVWPEVHWDESTPAEAGLDAAGLDAIAAFVGGRGCVVRGGKMVYTWGDATKRGDVASAVKPWFSTFLFLAVESGKIESLDTPLVTFEPRLAEINAALDHKDRNTTFRHAANQTSCYGVTEAPGSAFNYCDWQMALFADTLFGKVYGHDWDTVDNAVLAPLLADRLQCEDSPTFSAFGEKGRRGRLGVSPRDFARFGLLYLRQGRWRDTQVIGAEHARMAVTSPLPAALPRTARTVSEMIPDQRSLGSEKIPNDQTDHFGSYSWLWWVNGVDRDGLRNWPDAPKDTFCALGHKNGQRGLAVIPSLDLIISWNDTTLGDHPVKEKPLNTMLKLLVNSLRPSSPDAPASTRPE
jgi:CubicO group peptidase (beta-lactamase class C family)